MSEVVLATGRTIREYDYDLVGNRTEERRNKQSYYTKVYTYSDGSNQLDGVTAATTTHNYGDYQYSPTGNRTSKTKTYGGETSEVYTYNAANRLV